MDQKPDFSKTSSKLFHNIKNNVIMTFFKIRLLMRMTSAGLRMINRIVPKKDRQVIFQSVPDFSGNPKFFYEYLKSKPLENEYDPIWITEEENIAIWLNQNGIRAYSRKDFRWLIIFLRSRYIVVSHGNYSTIKASNQILVDLWHGMPLKAMGFVDNGETKESLVNFKRSSDSKDILIATSKNIKNALVSCFYIDPRKVYVTGQPRNDKLFSDGSRELLEHLTKTEIHKYSKVVLFAPTFRVWSKINRVEGRSQIQNLFGFEDYSTQKFQDFICQKRILFLLKLHPFEEEYVLSHYQLPRNIVLIKSGFLQENFADLYEILGAVDILITDYSSIYFDFLLLNRPILFVPTDVKDYTRNRGFVLEPYNFWTPGPKATTFNDFLRELTKCIDDPEYYQSERTVINNLINTYQDGGSCKRVFDVVEKLGSRVTVGNRNY